MRPPRCYNQHQRSPALILKVILEPGEDSGFVAHVPALRGCHSQGSSREETLANIRQAIALWLEVEQDKVETASPPVDIELVTI